VAVDSRPVSSIGAGVEFSKKLIVDKNGNCPNGTVPYSATADAQGVIKKKMMASGYGAPPARLLSPIQKRLLALRAAKLDAIRALAEQVSGIRIWGGATVSDLALKSDRLHMQLDAFIRGARVVSLNQMRDGSYEVVMALDFSRNTLQRLNLDHCLSQTQAQNKSSPHL